MSWPRRDVEPAFSPRKDHLDVDLISDVLPFDRLALDARHAVFVTCFRTKMSATKHAYEVRPRKDRPGVALISDVLPFGRLWYGEPNAVSNAIAYAMHYSCPHPLVIRVYDAAGNVIKTHEHEGDFKE